MNKPMSMRRQQTARQQQRKMAVAVEDVRAWPGIESLENRVLLSGFEPGLEPIGVEPALVELHADSNRQVMAYLNWNSALEGEGESAATSTSAISDSTLLNYIRTEWKIINIADAVLKATLDESYEGIPYREWISFLIKAPDFLEPLRQGDLETAISRATGIVVDISVRIAAKTLGLTSVLSSAKMAAWPIMHSLNYFYKSITELQLQRQALIYFQIRPNHTYEEIISDSSPDGLFTGMNGQVYAMTGDGWLFTYPTQEPPPSKMTSAEFFDYIEHPWRAKEAYHMFHADAQEIGRQFARDASVGAPIVTQHPHNQGVNVGGQVTFAVQAEGEGTLTYQWYRGAVAIEGATGPDLTTGEAGQYRVRVRNEIGETFSATASLTLWSGPPVVVVAPADQSVRQSYRGTFNVVVDGLHSMSYQWQLNGVDIPGATGSSYTTPPVAASDAGNRYAVRIQNSLGTVTSAAGTLALAPPLTFTWKGTYSTDWFDYRNWDRGWLPAVGDNIVITSGSLVIPDDMSIRSVAISGGTVTLDGLVTMTSVAVSGGTVTLGGLATVTNLSQSGGTVSGSGDLTVEGSMIWTGGTMRGSGQTTLLSGGTLQISGTVMKSLGRTLVNQGQATYDGMGLSFGPGSTELGVFENALGATFTVSGGGGFDRYISYPNSYFGGSFSNAGTLIKTGEGTTSTFASDVAFHNSGIVQVQSGTLSLSAFVLNAGTIAAGVGGKIVINGSFTNAASGTIAIEIGGTSITQFGRVIITGAAVLVGTLNLQRVDGFAPAIGSTFPIMTFGSRTGVFNEIAGTAAGNGRLFEPTYNSTALTLAVVATPPQTFVGTDGSDVFHVRLDSTGSIIQVFHNTPLTHPAIVTLDATSSSTLTFNTAAGNDTLILDLTNGNPLTAAGLTFDGGGDSNRLFVLGARSGEALSFTPTGAIIGSSTFSYTGVQAIELDDPQGSLHLRSLSGQGPVHVNLRDGAEAVMRLDSLSLADGALLDLADSTLFVQADNAPAAHAMLTQITEYIALARNGGNAGLWAGPGGITSSAAAAAGGLMSLGVGLDGNDVVVTYTWSGDTDLNGAVDGDDYFLIDSGFLQGRSGWQWGDLNYDGRVDGQDYHLIDRAFLAQAGQVPALGSLAVSAPLEPTASHGTLAMMPSLALADATPDTIMEQQRIVAGFHQAVAVPFSQRPIAARWAAAEQEAADATGRSLIDEILDEPLHLSL